MSTPQENIYEYNQKTTPEAVAPSVGGGHASSTVVSSAGGSVHRGVEQQPAMRSIAISHIPHRVLHFEPALKRESPGRIQPLSEFGRAPSNESTINNSLEFPKEQLYPDSHNTSSSDDVNLTPADRRWAVDHAVLQTRPDDYPLERTSRVIHGTKAEVISSRIAKCLQSRSIEAKFSKTENNVAECRNTDFCKFYIRLYLEKEGGDGGVLVEVQRLCGDCVSFMHDYRAVLDACEGKEVVKTVEKSIYWLLPLSEMSFMKDVPPLSKEEEVQPVNMTAELLASNQSDSNMLGMENLVTLTDSLQTVKPTAILSAKRILYPDHHDNKPFNMHNYVMSLVIFGNESEEKSFFEGTAMEEHDMRLRNLAICSVANSLALLAKEGCLSQTIDPCKDWYKDVLIPRLVQDLSTAGEHPHDGCYACRCLSSLATTCERLADKMKIVGGLYALKSAEEVGHSEFALLAQDASMCHKTIMRSCIY